MIALLNIIVFVYVTIAVSVHGYSYVQLLSDGSVATRHAIFWPLYAVRWLVVNFILAIKGR